MKLKIYNAENSKTIQPHQATVRMATNQGLFTFSKGAVKLLGLEADSRVIVVQDETEGDFFFHKTADPNGFQLRVKADGSDNPGNMSFNCKQLITDIVKDKTIKSVGYQIANATEIDGMPYHLIITSKPLGLKKF